MCRITGIIDKGSTQISVDATLMRDAMQHGGPDNAGLYVHADASLTFGHRRLSIIDLSDVGNQPMLNEQGNIALIFNGEIYNFRQLKNELKAAGFSFISQSDTEVVLKAYEHWGTRCFERFRGMFAIAVFDKKQNRVILARDHAGIKPLYYYCDGNSLYFASEIRAFKQLKKWEENPVWKVFFLTYGYLPHPVTTLKGVKLLQKGSYCIFDVHTLQFRQTCFFRDDYTEDVTDPGEARQLVKNALQEAVQRHLIADAPIGLFLSGGIDSSLLTLLAKPYKNELHTLSIVFDDEKYSEKKYQELIAQKTGSKHQAFLLNKELFLHALPDILKAMDQPSSDGINSYFISKFAKEAGLKAVLSGLGADEFFGGYASFKRAALLKKLRRIPGFVFGAAQFFPQDKYKKAGFLQQKNPLGEYLFNRGYFTPIETALLLDMDVREVNDLLYADALPLFVDEWSHGNKTSYLESNLYMEGQLLKDTDAMSMWHSIEVRVPFLDYDLIKAVQKISSDVKFGSGTGKFLLIDAFRDVLPEEIWNRKKQGFVFPFEVWMKENTAALEGGSKNRALTQKFQSGRLSWSRYWTYLVSQSFNV